MVAKSMRNLEDAVYSTFPEFEYEYAHVKEPDTLPPSRQNFTVSLEKRKIDGSITTRVKGFVGKRVDLIEIEQELEKVCRTCGSSRMYDIILKGDVRKRAFVYLRSNGYGVQFAG